MKVLFLAILFFSLVANAGWFGEGELESYAHGFITDSAGKLKDKDLIHTKLKLEEIKEYNPVKDVGVIGLCTRTIYSDQFTITIDRRYWLTAWDKDRWQLMYHELGHCMCNLNHPIDSEALDFVDFLKKIGIKNNRYKKFYDGCPVSLMHPYLVPTWCLDMHKTEYIHELFSNCRVYRAYNP